MSNSTRILIAEDEKPLARALSLKLEKEGISADLAYDGDMVQEMISKNEYGLILMDLMMPRHDGFAVLEELKEKKSATKVVVMSNLSQDTDRDRALAAGANHYFVKSDVSLSEIVTYIQKTLGT